MNVSGAIVKVGDLFYMDVRNTPAHLADKVPAGTHLLSAFGGKVDEGEDPATAMVREAGEEFFRRWERKPVLSRDLNHHPDNPLLLTYAHEEAMAAPPAEAIQAGLSAYYTTPEPVPLELHPKLKPGILNTFLLDANKIDAIPGFITADGYIRGAEGQIIDPMNWQQVARLALYDALDITIKGDRILRGNGMGISYALEADRTGDLQRTAKPINIPYPDAMVKTALLSVICDLLRIDPTYTPAEIEAIYPQLSKKINGLKPQDAFTLYGVAHHALKLKLQEPGAQLEKAAIAKNLRQLEQTRHPYHAAEPEDNRDSALFDHAFYAMPSATKWVIADDAADLKPIIDRTHALHYGLQIGAGLTPHKKPYTMDEATAMDSEDDEEVILVCTSPRDVRAGLLNGWTTLLIAPADEYRGDLPHIWCDHISTLTSAAVAKNRRAVPPNTKIRKTATLAA